MPGADGHEKRRRLTWERRLTPTAATSTRSHSTQRIRDGEANPRGPRRFRSELYPRHPAILPSCLRAMCPSRYKASEQLVMVGCCSTPC